MSIENAVDYMQNKPWNVSRLGLERIETLLHGIGDPQNKLKFLHIAGTNGKGSVAALTESTLRCAGYKTGLFTSPYIHDFLERIQVSGESIPGEAFSAITEYVKSRADDMPDHPTEFEMMTAVAFEYFYREKCDIVVLEVGLGGRLDSTNVINAPEAAVITSIGLDHTQILGDTVEKIAREKAGIIKAGTTLVAYPQTESVNAVFSEVCSCVGADAVFVDPSQIRPVMHDLHGQSFDFADISGIEMRLLGEHQLRNAATAITALRVLRDKGFTITDDDIRRGFMETRWPGRFEPLSFRPLFIVDGGHNPECAKTVAKNIEDYLKDKSITFVMGILADKDYETVIEIVAPYAKRFITVTPNSPRALDAEALASALRAKGLAATSAKSIECGIKLAMNCASNADDAIIAFGSLYMVGAIREYFNFKR